MPVLVHSNSIASSFPYSTGRILALLPLLQSQIFQTSTKKMATASAAPNPPPNHVYKVLPSAKEDPRYHFPSEGPNGRVAASQTFMRTPADASSPFIHLTTSQILPFVLTNFFKTTQEVTILKIDYGRLSAFHRVQWGQNSPNDPICPSLYGELTGEFVLESTTIAQDPQDSWKPSLNDLAQKNWLEW